MTIKTETDMAGLDLNRVSAVLHKEIDRGYVSPSQVTALVELLSTARRNAVDYDALQTAAYRDMQPTEEHAPDGDLRERVLAECDHLDRLGEDYAGTILNPRTAFQSAANLIRAVCDAEPEPEPEHEHTWVSQATFHEPWRALCITCRKRRGRPVIEETS